MAKNDIEIKELDLSQLVILSKHIDLIVDMFRGEKVKFTEFVKGITREEIDELCFSITGVQDDYSKKLIKSINIVSAFFLGLLKNYEGADDLQRLIRMMSTMFSISTVK